MKLTAILTCHNRRAQTLAALEALFAQADHRIESLDAIIMDDGSKDGTASAIRGAFGDKVKVLSGDGSLFWNRGMRLAFAEALSRRSSVYLWLNDDTILVPGALTTLLDGLDSAQMQAPQGSIIVGTTVDEEGVATYGGHRFTRRPMRPLELQPVGRSDVLAECDTMNGNCVLIPDVVARLVGNLDPCFEHAMGDTDYALRARAKGVRLCVAPGAIGVCVRNPVVGTFFDSSLPLRHRWQLIMSPKGLPWRSWLRFTRRHAGLLWPVYFLRPYASLLSRRSSRTGSST